MNNIEDVREFIGRQKWIFAKTYATRCPHEYIVRGKIKGTDDEFMKFVDFIQDQGQTMWFWSKVNRYLYVDGWYYWVMTDNMVQEGERVTLDYTDSTIIINRCDATKYFVSTRWKGLPK